MENITALWNKHFRWLLPTLIVAAIAPFTPFLDHYFASLAYDPERNPGFSSNSFFNLLFDYGEGPAWIVFAIAIVIYTLSYFVTSVKKWKSPALMLILMMFLGPGILVNGLFKEYWGRPRPRQVIEFGGNNTFRPFYSPDIGKKTDETFKSFPSGHASMGFYFFSLALLASRYNNKKLYWASLALTFTLGIALGTARIVQGGHFFSDVLISAWMMWICSLIVSWIVYDEKAKETVGGNIA